MSAASLDQRLRAAYEPKPMTRREELLFDERLLRYLRPFAEIRRLVRLVVWSPRHPWLHTLIYLFLAVIGAFCDLPAFREMAGSAGLEVKAKWTDASKLFAVVYLVVRE